MRIFYKTAGDRDKSVQEEDYGIFFDTEPSFRGRQYSIKHRKYEGFYDYERFMFGYYRKNKDHFCMGGKDISFMANPFLLLTFDFFSYNSIGNHLTLIDIFEDILRKRKKEAEPVDIYGVDDDETESLMKKCLEKHGISRYGIHRGEKRGTRASAGFIRRLIVARLRWRHMAKLFTKRRDHSKDTIFLQPLGIRFDIHKNIKEQVESYEILRYELADRMARKEELWNMFLEKKEPLTAQFYTARHFRDLRKMHREFREKHRQKPMTRLVYKGIDLTEESREFFGLFFEAYAVLIADGLLIAQRICASYKTVFFSPVPDPLLHGIAITKEERCRRFAVQSEMIYKGCRYFVFGSQVEKDMVWNDYSRKTLIGQYGYDADEVAMIGNIRFLDVRKKKHEKITVLFASQGIVQPAALQFFIETCKMMRNRKLEFLVKPHPVEDIVALREMIRGTDIGLAQQNLQECLAKTDVLVTHSSGTALDAIYNRIPVVIVNPNTTLPPGIPFYRHFRYFTKKEECADFFGSMDWKTVKRMRIPKQLEIPKFRKDEFKRIIEEK